MTSPVPEVIIVKGPLIVLACARLLLNYNGLISMRISASGEGGGGGRTSRLV